MKKRYLIIAVICFAAAAAAGFVAWQGSRLIPETDYIAPSNPEYSEAGDTEGVAENASENAVAEKTSDKAATADTEGAAENASENAVAEKPSDEAATEDTEETTPYVSPIDFDQLQSENPDIYGWITIPDTNIDYPLLQSSDYDTYYLDHSPDGSLIGLGSLFSEHEYNKTDFSDRVHTIYGHHMRNGEMFGRLQEYYSGEENVKAHRNITIYTPEAERNYTVFAAVPFDKRHLMDYYGFDDDDDVERFLEDIYSVRAFDAYFDEDVRVTKSDKLLILSTCLAGDNTQRFLVIAVEE